MRRLFGLCAFLLFPSHALAWSGDGHQIVCLIAEARLILEVQAEVHKLLGDDVNISDGEICMFADNIRHKRRETAPWHYVNIPTSQPAYDPLRDGKDGDNVIDAIARFEIVLADNKRQSRRNRSVVDRVIDLLQIQTLLPCDPDYRPFQIALALPY